MVTTVICASVRVSPRLSPSGPLRIRHSSICPKGENMTRMSFSLHFLDTMPMNSFLSSTAEQEEVWRKQVWWTMWDKRVGLNNVTAARDQCLISTSRPERDSLFTNPSVFIFPVSLWSFLSMTRELSFACNPCVRVCAKDAAFESSRVPTYNLWRRRSDVPDVVLVGKDALRCFIFLSLV